MSKKPHPTVQVTVKLSPEVADKLYKIALTEFGGNLSDTLREGIKLLISSREPLKLERLQELRIMQPSHEKAGTKLIVRLEESADET